MFNGNNAPSNSSAPISEDKLPPFKAPTGPGRASPSKSVVTSGMIAPPDSINEVVPAAILKSTADKLALGATKFGFSLILLASLPTATLQSPNVA